MNRKIIYLIFFMCMFMTACPAGGQTYKNLVFEGAGIRGLAYAGAIKELEEKKVLDQIEKVGGTSAGAIAALTVALGYNSSEIVKIIGDTKLQKFNDGRFFFFGGISRMNRHYGWYRGKAFTHWLEKIITSKTGNSDITFQELYDRKFRDLYVTGTSLSQQRLIIFSRETFPNMKIKDAVRISMSIPLYFEAVFMDSTGHIMSSKKPKGNYHIMVDGGLIGNFPIFIFDTIVTSKEKTQRKFNENTLGLRIDTPGQISKDIVNQELAPIPIGNFQNYIGAFYNYVIENLNRNFLTPSDWSRTVSISSGDIGPKVKRLSSAEKDTLIANGRQAVKLFLIEKSRRLVHGRQP